MGTLSPTHQPAPHDIQYTTNFRLQFNFSPSLPFRPFPTNRSYDVRLVGASQTLRARAIVNATDQSEPFPSTHGWSILTEKPPHEYQTRNSNKTKAPRARVWDPCQGVKGTLRNQIYSNGVELRRLRHLSPHRRFRMCKNPVA